MDKKLSIIVPIYGVEKYLRQCLDSIAAQTFKEFECILVDDGSRDRCPAICDEYALKDERFKVIHKQNAGYGAAVNTGLDVAHGEWIGIVEPDDWIESQTYELLLAHAKQNVDVVKSGFDSFYDDGGKSFLSSHFDAEAIPSMPSNVVKVPWLLSWHPSIWTCIYRLAFLNENKIRMETSNGAAWQDNLFQVQTLILAGSISCVPKNLYHYRVFKAKPLKDPLLPIQRSIQIRRWLMGRGYREQEPCAALFVREMNYVWMTIDGVMFVRLPQVAMLVAELIRIYRSGFNHNYDFKSRGLGLMERCPLIGVIFEKIKRMPKVNQLLRALHLR